MLAVCETRPHRVLKSDFGRMLNDVRITHFKCFRELYLQDLGAVNVIVGDSGSGKTALLESLFLSQSGTPEVILRLRVWRGLGNTVTLAVNKQSYEALWRNLFYGFDQKQAIRIVAHGSSGLARTLKVHYDKQAPSEISAPTREGFTKVSVGSTDSMAITPITFEYTHDTEGVPSTVIYQPSFQGDMMKLGIQPIPSLAAFFASSFASVVMPGEVAEQFSLLSKAKQAGKFITQMRKLFPRIRDISVEFEGNSPMLYCDVATMAEMVPIGLLSSGMHKLAALMLGIAHHSKGIVLIDELENGIYYKLLPEVWKALHSFAKAFNVQLFVSTHSKECLQAIGPLLDKHASDFRLIRMESAKGVSKAKVFTGKEFEAATVTEVEFR